MKARRIVAALLRDMLGRRGFRQNWDEIDDDIKDEIVKQWEALVLAELLTPDEEPHG